MMRLSLGYLIVILMVGGGILAGDLVPADRGPTGTVQPLGDTPLFSNLANIAPTAANSATSQYFPDQPPGEGGFFTVGMDDFTVPAGKRWKIESVRVVGNYTLGIMNPAESINVFIVRADQSGARPATTDIYNSAHADVFLAGDELAYSDTDIGDFDIPLPTPVLLDEGTYFIGVQAVLGSANQWLWTESSSQVDSGVPLGAASVWMENSQIFGPPACVNAWGERIADCNVTDQGDTSPPEPDLAFALFGTAAPLALDLDAPVLLDTSEAGDNTQFNVRLGAEPRSAVTLRFTSATPGEVLLSRPDTDSTTFVNVVFSPDNWDEFQQVLVYGQDDPYVDPAGAVVITTSIISDDTGYAALEGPELFGVNRDDACDIYRHDGAIGSSAAAATKSTNGNWLAYHSSSDVAGTNSDGNQEIFLYNSLTGLNLQVTQTTGVTNRNPIIRGDGRQILFTSNGDLTGENAAGREEVFSWDALTQTTTQVTTSNRPEGAEAAAISDDGTIIAVLSNSDWDGANKDGSRELYRYDLAQSQIVQISSGGDHVDDADAHNAVMDASGTRLAYTHGAQAAADLFTWDSGSALSSRVRAGIHDALSLSSDGRWLALVSAENIDNLNSEGNAEAFVYNLDMQSFQAGTQTATATVAAVTINNAGLLALVSNADYLGGNSDGGFELYLHPLGSAGFRQLTTFADNLVVQGRVSAVNLGRDNDQCSYIFNADLTPRIYMTGVRTTFFVTLPTWFSQPITVLQLLPFLCESAFPNPD